MSECLLTAGLGGALVPPGVVEELVLLLGEEEPLLLHLVDLLLGADGVVRHLQVLPQHHLLLLLPLGPGVLQLGALWGGRGRRGNMYSVVSWSSWEHVLSGVVVVMVTCN